MAAPVVLELTPFPGVRLHAGRWHQLAFPACGCDGCDETSDGEAERLQAALAAVTSGTFMEAVEMTGHEAWLVAWVGSTISRQWMTPEQARQLLNAVPESPIRWRPWPRRQPQQIRRAKPRRSE